jgi:hypothetical protein
MFPGIKERRLALCGEPKVSPPPGRRSKNERHQQAKGSPGQLSERRGGTRRDLHGPGRVRLLRKHRISITPGAAKLRQLGLQKWIQPFRAKAEYPQVLGRSNVFLLTIAGGAWHEGWSKDGGPFTDQDDGTYRISGDTVLFTPTCCPAEIHTWRWSVQGGTLRLTSLGIKNGGSFQGIPPEVFQVFYDTAPFRRQP